MIFFMSLMEASPSGASEKLWADAAVRLRRSGQEVVASVKRWPQLGDHCADLERHGVRLMLRDRDSAFRYEKHMAEIVQLRPTFVVLSAGDNGFSAIWVAEVLMAHDIPYVLICHNSVLFWPPDSVLKRAREVYRAARRVCFVSNRNMTDTELMIGERFLNATIVRSPVGVAYDVSLPWPVSSVARLAVVGRLDPSTKGHDLLFRALDSPAWRDRNVQISIYGSGQNEESLRQLKDMLNLPMVRFAGSADANEIWSQEQMLVLPSRCEGLPLVLLEAMLSRRPAVVTDVGDSSEFMIDGITGFVAEAAEVRSIARALERAWNSRQSWRELGERSGQRVRELFPRDPVGRFIGHLSDVMSMDDCSIRSSATEEVPTSRPAVA